MKTACAGKWRLWLAAAVTVAIATTTLPGGEPQTKPAADSGEADSFVIDKTTIISYLQIDEENNKIAHMRLTGTVLNSPMDFSPFSKPSTHMTLRDWLSRLAKARNDPAVGAVALEIDSVQLNWAQAQELADAVRRLDKVKPVYAYLKSGGTLQYLVASAGRELVMEPGGTLMICGLGAEIMFFRGTLDFIGVQPQIIQIGRFKGAGEPMSRTQPSKELIGQYNNLLDDLFGQLCGQITRQRRLTLPHVKHTIDQNPLTAPEAKKYMLVDHLVTRTEWKDHVARRIAQGETDPDSVWLAEYKQPQQRSVNPSNPWNLLNTVFSGGKRQEIKDPTVAIIHAEGIIVSGSSGRGLFGQRYVGARTLSDIFKSVTEDDRIKAVVFRIDSPGGSALASEMIYQAARKCAKVKPVISSITRVGGSGGYYIALAGSEIIADPASITGSIGVVAGKFAYSGLLKKLGISTYEITRGKHAGLGMARPWNEEELAVIRKLARRTYDLFVRRTVESRGRKINDMDAVAQGRIFTARQAAKNGLIDRIGGLRDAIIAAHKAAKLDRSYFITLPRSKTFMEVIFSGSGAPTGSAFRTETALLQRCIGRSKGLAYMLKLSELFQNEFVLTAMPYYVSIRP